MKDRERSYNEAETSDALKKEPDDAVNRELSDDEVAMATGGSRMYSRGGGSDYRFSIGDRVRIMGVMSMGQAADSEGTVVDRKEKQYGDGSGGREYQIRYGSHGQSRWLDEDKLSPLV